MKRKIKRIIFETIGLSTTFAIINYIIYILTEKKVNISIFLIILIIAYPFYRILKIK